MLLTVILSSWLSLTAVADSVSLPPCTATQFPYARNQSDRDLRELFESLDRSSLEAYYFHELTSVPATRPDRVSRGLASYLAQTELDRDRRDFYRVLPFTAGWKNKTGRPHSLDLQSLCEARAAALSRSR